MERVFSSTLVEEAKISSSKNGQALINKMERTDLTISNRS
jgi:hypothetical protein